MPKTAAEWSRKWKKSWHGSNVWLSGCHLMEVVCVSQCNAIY
jgi:hypothetical protein